MYGSIIIVTYLVSLALFNFFIPFFSSQSWLVKTKATSNDDFPIRHVVKNYKSQGKKPVEETNLHPKKGVKQEVHGIALQPTKAIKKETVSSDTWSDPIIQEKSKRLRAGNALKVDCIAKNKHILITFFHQLQD